jgi:hypothetical protein
MDQDRRLCLSSRSIPLRVSIHREASRSSPSVASLLAKGGDAPCGSQSIRPRYPPSSGDFATMELSYARRFPPPPRKQRRTGVCWSGRTWGV